MLGLLGLLFAAGSGIKQSVQRDMEYYEMRDKAKMNGDAYFLTGRKFYMTDTEEEVKPRVAGNGTVFFSVETGDIVYKTRGAKLDRLPWTWMPPVYRGKY